MQIPVQITFRHMDASPALETYIRERVAELERFHARLIGCRVVIEMDHRHQQGNLFHVRADLTVPGHELVAARESTRHQAYEDPYVAVRDTFDSLRRQLEDLARRQRGDVKHHDTPAHGRITALSPTEDCGTITTADGREIYFHRHSVVDGDYERLTPGTQVRFTEERGEQGPQASTVHVVGKHHIVG